MKNKPIRIVIRPVNSQRIGGFTLVELLVTITIIAVLAAVVMTVTQKVKASAYRANAVSSLRQISIGNAAYAAENAGDINVLRDKGDPIEGNNLKGIGDAWVKNTFWGRLQPHLFPAVATTNQKELSKNLVVAIAGFFNIKLVGPESENAETLKKMAGTVLTGTGANYGDTSGLPVPFAFSTGIYKWGVPVKVSSVSDPSQTLYLTFGAYRCDEVDGKTYVPMPKNGAKATNNIYYLDDQKALFTFVDGHIESLSAPIAARKFK